MAPSQQHKKNVYACNPRSVNNLFSRFQKITEITSVINRIAFQTTILALNASVKAARAGEMGLEFAVIAGEVRDLAQQSGQAAKKIATLVDESVKLVGKDSLLVDSAGQAMREMAASVINMSGIMEDIASASNTIGADSAAALEGNPAWKNAVLVRKAGATAASLEAQASLLINVVSIFRLSQTLAVGGVQNVLAR